MTVSIVQHDQLAVVAALDDVVRVRGNSKTRLAGHRVLNLKRHVKALATRQPAARARLSPFEAV
jgi:hypothetical protein